MNGILNNNISLTPINAAKVDYTYIPSFCVTLLTGERNATCPSLNGNATLSDAHLRAMEILKMPDIQQMLTFEYACPDDAPGYNPVPQQQFLKQLTHNQNLTNFIFNSTLHNQIADYNTAHPGLYRIDRGELISRELAGLIDLSQLERKEEFHFQTSIYKSYKEIRQAKPGDHDITVYVISNPSVDNGGAFNYLQFERTIFNGLKTISQKYPIHYIEANSAEQLLERAEIAKKEIGNIKIFLVAGHGQVDRITLGPLQTFFSNFYFSRWRFKPTYWLEEEPLIENKLPIDADGTVILYGCNGGAGGLANPNNLVNQIAFAHPGKTVIGLTKSVAPVLRVDNLAERVFSLIYEKEDVTYRAKVIQDSHLDSALLTQV